MLKKEKKKEKDYYSSCTNKIDGKKLIKEPTERIVGNTAKGLGELTAQGIGGNSLVNTLINAGKLSEKATELGIKAAELSEKASQLAAQYGQLVKDVANESQNMNWFYKAYYYITQTATPISKAAFNVGTQAANAAKEQNLQ